MYSLISGGARSLIGGARSPFRLLSVAGVILLVGLACRAGEPPPDEPVAVMVEGEWVPVSNAIRDRVEADGPDVPGPSAAVFLAGEPLPGFYRDRDFEPAWIEGHELSEKGEVLLDWIRASERDGFDPDHYHLQAIESLRFPEGGDGGERGEQELRRLADLDLLLTDAFMVLGSHFLHGRVDPEDKAPVREVNRNGTAMEELLESALNGGTGHLRGALRDLRPAHSAYDQLREGLVRHLGWAEGGGWGAVSDGDVLEEGDRGSRVAELRARLAVTRDYPAGAEDADDPERFDADLREAVMAFQLRHGIEADGLVGAETLDALNVPVEERIDQLIVGMERWRWLPRDLGDDHILVNIPGFETWVVMDGERTMTLRSIVGQEYRQTPVFSEEMTHLVLAPRWYVPASMAAEDHLPQIRENPDFLDEQRMVVVDRETGEELDPEEIDWEEIGEEDFEEWLLLRQEPGSHNALGQVQFMFPNEHNVYLHDTSEPELFDERVRDFSSGCIRVERALELAELLLEPDPEWDRERMEEAIAEGEELEVPLDRRIPVHIQYWTAWVDEDGGIQYRADIYERDEEVLVALERRPSG